MAWGAGAVDSRFCTQVYAAELAPPKLRGPLGGLFNVFISAGILAVFALGARGTDDGVWRWMAFAAVAPALAVGLGLHRGWVPESPRWLALRGRLDEARRVSVRLGLRAPDKGEVKHPLVRRDSSLADLAHYSSAMASRRKASWFGRPAFSSSRRSSASGEYMSLYTK